MQPPRGRTRLSSRGQVVIPKEVREHLGLNTGQELEVFTEGPVICLVPVGRAPTGAWPAMDSPDQVRERPDAYEVAPGRGATHAVAPTASELVRRVKAVGRLRRLRDRLAGRGLDWDALWAKAQEDRR